MKVVDIPVDDIQIINRMRKTDDSKIKELSESIKDIGLLHPITVAEKDNQYVILAGEHRYRSFKLLTDQLFHVLFVRITHSSINW